MWMAAFICEISDGGIDLPVSADLCQSAEVSLAMELNQRSFHVRSRDSRNYDQTHFAYAAASLRLFAFQILRQSNWISKCQWHLKTTRKPCDGRLKPPFQFRLAFRSLVVVAGKH